MVSPTQRSLKLLRDEGYFCAVAEYWNSFTKTRKDLFGFIDIVALKDGETLAVQTTTNKNAPARIRKIEGLDSYPIVKRAGWKVVVHGWRKLKSTNKWECRIERLNS